jgi:hypothetical protein
MKREKGLKHQLIVFENDQIVLYASSSLCSLADLS